MGFGSASPTVTALNDPNARAAAITPPVGILAQLTQKMLTPQGAKQPTAAELAAANAERNLAGQSGMTNAQYDAYRAQKRFEAQLAATTAPKSQAVVQASPAVSGSTPAIIGGSRTFAAPTPYLTGADTAVIGGNGKSFGVSTKKRLDSLSGQGSFLLGA